MTMTTTTGRRVELAHRTSAGIDVYLFWKEPTNRVTVVVVDARADGDFELEVDGRDALDAFNHPYAFQAGDSQATTADQWRSDHARTDR